MVQVQTYKFLPSMQIYMVYGHHFAEHKMYAHRQLKVWKDGCAAKILIGHLFGNFSGC